MLSDIGVDVKRQDKIGLTHYFAPPHIVPGVEVAKGPGTLDQTYHLVYDSMKKGAHPGTQRAARLSAEPYSRGQWVRRHIGCGQRSNYR